MLIAAFVVSVVSAVVAALSVAVAVWQTRIAKQAARASEESARASTESARASTQLAGIEAARFKAEREPQWQGVIHAGDDRSIYQLELKLASGASVDHVTVEIQSPGVHFTHSQTGVDPGAPTPITRAVADEVGQGDTVIRRVEVNGNAPQQVTLQIDSSSGADTWHTRSSVNCYR